MIRGHAIILLALVSVAVRDPAWSAPLHRRDEESIDDYPFEGWDGLKEQMKIVHKKSGDEITKAAANIGLLVGGLASNAATQALRKTTRCIEKGKVKIIDSIERVQEAGNSGLQMMQGAVSATGNVISQQLESLSNILDGVATTLNKRRKRKKKKVEQSESKSEDEVPVQ